MNQESVQKRTLEWFTRFAETLGMGMHELLKRTLNILGDTAVDVARVLERISASLMLDVDSLSSCTSSLLSSAVVEIQSYAPSYNHFAGKSCEGSIQFFPLAD
ncbi:MAG: hypothetical protein HGB04_09930 [Chlorobiaceae bacterium]|nr:hypothetical protein [Chlorobiaceae bacterium]